MKPFKFLLRDETMVSIEDYRQRAMQMLPFMVWQYLDGGADDLTTLRDNILAFSRLRLRQRVLSEVAAPDLSTTLLGTPTEVPFGIAPTGLSGLVRWDGDLAIARAAEKAGTRFALSTGSSFAMEEVAEATDQPHWFQLYAKGSREIAGALMERAQHAGYSALIVTVDATTPGNREGERKHGFGVPLRLTPMRCLDMALHPRWLYQLMRHRRMAPAHSSEKQLRKASDRSFKAAAEAVEAQSRSMLMNLSWDDIAWMRSKWRGRLYIKGVLDPEDARRAVHAIGAEGVIVSNHGGRQLDDVLASADALPAVVSALAGRGEVYLDGGIRRGTDIVKALCLGADGVLIGRPALYGAAVAGEAGVSAILSILRDEVRRALILMGCTSAKSLNRSWLVEADGAV